MRAFFDTLFRSSSSRGALGLDDTPSGFAFEDDGDVLETIHEGDDCDEGTTVDKVFAKGIKQTEILNVIEAVREAERVDLCFIIDSTGSMKRNIDQVKSTIRDIVRKIKRTNVDLDLRLAVVAYRDYGDVHRHRVLKFTGDLLEFENFVASLKAEGGGDIPEDMAGAIRKANELNWLSPTRVVFLIADAPCHGKKFHTLRRDTHPCGSRGVDIVAELRKLQSTTSDKGTMTLHFGRITFLTNKMIKVFQANGINIDVVHLRNQVQMASSVTSAVRSSISKTISVSSGSTSDVSTPDAIHQSSSNAVIRPPTPVTWKNKAEAVPVQVYRNLKIDALRDVPNPLGIGVYKPTSSESQSMLLRRSPDPFAEGETRLAYHGQMAHGNCEDNNLNAVKNAVVLKVFKRDDPTNDRAPYFWQMEISNIAHFLANEYNKSSYRGAHCKSVHFLQARVVEETSTIDDNKRYICAEPLLPKGNFVKFGNNTGYWNAEHLDETLLRFTLFTFEATGGYLILTDLQGVKNRKSFVLTDPAILCKDILRFGGTNLGPVFMKKCVDSTRAHLAENGWMSHRKRP